MSLLTIVQEACTECNLASPASAVGSADPNVQKMILFAQRTGNEAARRWYWLDLKSDITFTGNGVATLFPLGTTPSAFASFSPSTLLISSVYPTVPLVGPINDEQMQQIKALGVSSSPAVWRRVASDQIEFYPALASGEIVTGRMLSKFWITTAGGSPNNPVRFNADTDVSLIDEELIALGAVWRFKRSNGLDYAEEFNTYQDTLDQLASQENQMRVINMTTTVPLDLDTWFPGTITDLTTHNL